MIIDGGNHHNGMLMMNGGVTERPSNINNTNGYSSLIGNNASLNNKIKGGFD